MWDFPLYPEQASSYASRVDAAFLANLAVFVFFTGLICVLVLFFAVRYRRGARGSHLKAPVNHNVKLEIFWIAVPLAISMCLFVWGTNEYFLVYDPPADASEIAVVGKQWMWYLQHPEGRREINELHLPLGRPVKLRMISQDVIHSFYVPAFRAKQDVLPGRYTSMWFQPTKVGRHHLFCAEYCGTRHFGMGGWVIVMEPSEYERWLESGTVSENMATAGARLFQRYGCSGCHGANSSIRAPRLEGVFGHIVPLSNGQVVTADERYIRDSILLPKSQVVAGYEPVMPTFQGQMNEDDLLQLIAYIKQLGQVGGTER